MAQKRARRRATAGARLEFNHAMIYTRNHARALAFYRDRLGFTVLDQYPGAYARLRSPGGSTTIALHCLERGQRMDPAREGIRLYFEIRRLDSFCARLAAAGVAFLQKPKDMPWGWRHAYLRDPDGHELSLYWAGRKRFQKTAP
ncbi:MAG TPA: VOC family protein [Vicinamibacteria bacterium]|nr:VOC family protein [Vicinamibacteria bacterium]